MDLSNFKTHDWLKVGGGALFLIAGFLPWWSAGRFGSANAFDYTLTGLLPWLIFVAIGVLSFLDAGGVFKLPENIPAPTIFLIASAVGTLLVLIRMFDDGTGFNALDRGAGLFLALIAGVVVTAGSYMSFTATGGNLAELGKSLQSKASSGQKSDATASDDPPPPPPSDEEQPPPPPPSS